MSGKSQDFSMGLKKKKKRLSMGQRTGPTILETFVGDNNLDHIHNHGLRIITCTLYYFQEEALNTFPMGRCLFVSIYTCGVRSQIHRSIMEK